METNFINLRLIDLQKSVGILLFLITLLSSAYAQGNLTQYKPSPKSDDEVLKIINNPQNQNDAELIMLIQKSIEEKNITDINKKIAFIDSFNVTDYIKVLVKRNIKQGITYSDYERVSYGVYQFKKCKNKKH